MDIPSGMLWIAIANVKDKPKFMLFVVDMKVAIPSGTLWIIIANIDIIPTLYRLLLVVSGIFLDINEEKIIPIMVNRNDNIIVIKADKLCFSIVNDYGIRSVIDTQSITPDANASDAHIILFSCFNFKKIGSVPIKVDNPAIMVNKKAIFILFI